MARNKYPEETVKLILAQARKLFLKKGYDDTSIQDILNNLGGLSKGAIYHHFRSKEEIYQAVCEDLGTENMEYYIAIRDDHTKTGHEKLVLMLQGAYQNPNNQLVLAMAHQIMSDPKFVLHLIFEMSELTAPQYIQPVIEQGIQDGTIVTDYPMELAEMILVLLNLWVNPMLFKHTTGTMRRKLELMRLMLQGIGVDVLGDEMIDSMVRYYSGIALAGG